MSDTPNEPVKFGSAEPKHEAFYQAVITSALALHLRDEEIAAVVGRLLGYHRATTPTHSSVEHLVTVFRKNMRRAEDDYTAGRVPVRP